MGAAGKPAFTVMNAGSPTGLGLLRSAREARCDELLRAALERQPEGLRLGPAAGLERDVHDQPVNADPELARLDAELDQLGVPGVLDLLDDLAVEDEGDRRHL